MYHVAELKPFVIFLRPPPISEISQLTVSGPCVGRSTHTGQKHFAAVLSVVWVLQFVVRVTVWYGSDRECY